MDIPALQSHVKPADLPLESIAGNKSITQEQKVAEVSRQFESVLLRQILSEARKTVISSSETPESSSSGIYSDMINNQLADSISRSGTFGLARSLQGQLAHQVLKPAHASPTPVAVPTAASVLNPHPKHSP